MIHVRSPYRPGYGYGYGQAAQHPAPPPAQQTDDRSYGLALFGTVLSIVSFTTFLVAHLSQGRR